MSDQRFNHASIWTPASGGSRHSASFGHHSNLRSRLADFFLARKNEAAARRVGTEPAFSPWNFQKQTSPQPGRNNEAMKTYPNPNPLTRFGAAAAVALAALFFAAVPEAKAQYQVTTLATAVVENFDGLTVPVINPMTAGNKLAFSGALGSTTQTQRNSAWSLPLLVNNATGARGVGNDVGNTSQTGGYRAYDDNSTATDRSLGYRGSTAGNNSNVVATFDNVTSSTVTSFVLSFTGENWYRNNNARTLTVEYSINGGAFTAAGMTSFTSLSGVAANINGDDAANRTTGLGGTVNSISLANGQNIQFRFLFGGGTSSSGFALDDLSVTFNGSAPPVDTDYYWTGVGAALGGTGTWNTANTTWSATNSPITPIVWDSSKKAIFAGTAGTVTVSTVSANAGIQFSTTGYSLTNGTLTLGGASIGVNAITTDTGVTTAIGTTLSGTAGMTKSGAGTLVLSGANNFSGGIALSAGGLSVSAANNLGDAGNDIAFGGGTLVTTASFETGSGADFSGSGTINIAGGTTLTNNGAFNMGGLTLNNTGTLVLNGATRTVGNLAFSAGGTINGSGAITVTGLTADSLTTGTATINPAIVFSSGDKTTVVGTGGNLVLNGDLSGTTGRILKQGAGTLEVNGNNTIGGFRLGSAGTSPINGGTLVVGTAASMGTNTFQFNYGTLVAKAPMTITNALSIGGRVNGGAAAVVGRTNAIEFSGPVSWFGANTTNSQLNVDNHSTFSGVIASATTTDTQLIFAGSGTMTMSGTSANTFTNQVVISNTQTVELAKTASTAALSGSSVEIYTGATLLISASEQVSDATAVTLSGGTISRASGVSETFGALNLTADSTLDFVGGSSGILAFGIYEGDATPNFKLTINSFFIGNKVTFANDLSAYIDASFVGTSFSNSYFAINGMSSLGFESNWNGSIFTITAVPEPSTYAAAAGLVCLLLWPARRRIVRDAQRILGLRRPMRDRLESMRAASDV